MNTICLRTVCPRCSRGLRPLPGVPCDANTEALRTCKGCHRRWLLRIEPRLDSPRFVRHVVVFEETTKDAAAE